MSDTDLFLCQCTLHEEVRDNTGHSIHGGQQWPYQGCEMPATQEDGLCDQCRKALKIAEGYGYTPDVSGSTSRS